MFEYSFCFIPSWFSGIFYLTLFNLINSALNSMLLPYKMFVF